MLAKVAWMKLSSGGWRGEWFLRGWMALCLAGVLWTTWDLVRAQDSGETNTVVEVPVEASAGGTIASEEPVVEGSGAEDSTEPLGVGGKAEGEEASEPIVVRAASRVAEAVTGRNFIEANRDELSFGLAKVPAFQYTFLGKPIWQYIATLLYVFLALAVSKGLDWVIKRRIEAITSRTKVHWDDVLVRMANGPVKMFSFVILLHIGLQLFDWPPFVETIVSKGAFILIAFSIVYVLLKTVDGAMDIWDDHLREDADKAFNQQFIVLVGKLVKVVLCLIAFLTLLQNLGVNITAILGSVSILGLALGLAAQDTVGNLFGAVAVFMDRPFRVGDRVKIGTDAEGFVEEMGLRATRIRTLEGFLVTVPNKTVGTNVVTNITRRPTIRGNFAVGITYDTPAPKVKRAAELLEEIYRGHPLIADVIVHFNKFADYYLNLDVLLWCKSTDWKQYCAAVQEIHLTIKERFDAEGIEFALPTRTIHLQTSGGSPTDPGAFPSPAPAVSSGSRG